MNRRSFLSGVLAWLAALFGGRLFRRRLAPPVPDGFRRLSEPYVIEPGVPIGLLPSLMLAPWPGRIVRLAMPLPGQKQACCACVGVNEAAFAEPHGCPYSSDDNLGRTPILGSPERAYLEYVAREHPHPEYQHSEYHVLRRLESGEISVDEVYIRLATAEELDIPGSAYAGGRGEAFALYISVLA